MSDDDLTGQLTRTLTRYADDMAGPSLPLAQVQGRARSIRRRRTAGAVVGAAAAVAVVVPTLALATHGGGHRTEPLPSTQNTTSQTPSPSQSGVVRAPLDVRGLPLGDAPADGYLVGRTLHLPNGSTTRITTAAPVDAYVTLSDDTIVLHTRDAGGATAVEVIDSHGDHHGPYPATDGVVVDANHAAAGWVGTDGHPYFWNEAATKPDRSDAQVSGGSFEARALADTCDSGGTSPDCAMLVRTTAPSTGKATDWLASLSPGDDTVQRAAPDRRFVGLTDLSYDGREIGLTRITDTGSCSGVAAGAAPVTWKTCRHTLLAFSPRGSYLSADVNFHSGLGSSVFAAYDYLGHQVFEYRSRLSVQATVTRSVWEDDAHVLAIVYQDGRWYVVRFGVDGSRELAAGPLRGNDVDAPVVVPGAR
ncbi:MAG: hypothetical protein QM747_20165 [Nocardioides sp.]